VSNGLPTALREDLFPGNTDAFEQLRNFVDSGNLTVFTGAGVSAPLFPTWNSFLVQQLHNCVAEGSISQSEAQEYRSLIDKDHWK
jgi:hypothetical protein